jgi:predicted nuclease of predicted toxin-antitoxin system
MIIFDENIDQLIIDSINKKNYDYLSIRDTYPGITDREIIEINKFKSGIIITEDKDFGELVFAYGIKSFSVFFLRYKKNEIDTIINNIHTLLDKYYHVTDHYFITITKQKVRVNRL